MGRDAIVMQLRRHAQGCFELCLFMKSGVTFFEDSKTAQRFSFLLIFLLMPVGMPLLFYAPDYADIPAMQKIMSYFLRFFTAWPAYLVCMYFITRWLGVRDRYRLFTIVYNWLAFPQALLTLVALLLLIVGNHPWEAVYGYLVFILLFGVTVTSYSITHILRVHPVMAIGLTILSLVIDMAALYLFGPHSP